MPGIWVVLVLVAPFPAAISPGELRTAERADVLPSLTCGERIVCHLLDPLRRCWPCAWPGGSGVVVAAPAAGCSRSDQPTPRRAHCTLDLEAHPRSGGHWQGIPVEDDATLVPSNDLEAGHGGDPNPRHAARRPPRTADGAGLSASVRWLRRQTTADHYSVTDATVRSG
jgi:hypothetical protein